MDEPRTEPATPRKLARARRQGIVPKSPDLVFAAVLFALLGTLFAIGGRLLQAFRTLLTEALRSAAAPNPPGLEHLAAPARDVATLSLILLLALSLAALLANVLQVGPLFAAALAAPDLRRLDPFARLRALFSARTWLGLSIAVGKTCVLLATAAWVLYDARHALATLGAGSPARALFVLCALALQVALYVAGAALLLGVADLVYRRTQHARAMRMSRREWTEEQRESSGLPEHRRLRRRLHAELLAQRALEDASVLLTDGRQRALALSFDAEVDPAPRIALKAQGALADDARARAERAGIPTRVAPALVAALFPLELTEPVPRAHYEALADLMRELIANGQMRAVAPIPLPAPTRDTP